MGYFNDEHPTLLADAVGARDHVRGPASADVTVVEYGDFACPSCRRAHPMVKDLLAAHPDVCFVFRANPRSHLFPDAAPAAEGAEAAAARGSSGRCTTASSRPRTGSRARTWSPWR